MERGARLAVLGGTLNGTVALVLGWSLATGLAFVLVGMGIGWLLGRRV
jgi:hypothetical protein